jgi:cytidylate kinase
MYRGVSWFSLEAGIPVDDLLTMGASTAAMDFKLLLVNGAVHFQIGGRDPGDALRSEPVRARVSAVAAMPAVRTAVTKWLRSTTQFGNLVMDGRDIATVVFPDAQFKFYVDAEPVERARRRHAELVRKGEIITLDAVVAEQARRDKIDSTRAEAPLRIAPGAIVINTTGMTIDQVVATIAGAVRT